MKVGAVTSTEVATGGDPQRALAKAMLPFAAGPYVISVTVAHDDSCPCTAGTKPMRACTCEVVRVEAVRVA